MCVHGVQELFSDDHCDMSTCLLWTRPIPGPRWHWRTWRGCIHYSLTSIIHSWLVTSVFDELTCLPREWSNVTVMDLINCYKIKIAAHLCKKNTLFQRCYFGSVDFTFTPNSYFNTEHVWCRLRGYWWICTFGSLLIRVPQCKQNHFKQSFIQVPNR